MREAKNARPGSTGGVRGTAHRPRGTSGTDASPAFGLRGILACAAVVLLTALALALVRAPATAGTGGPPDAGHPPASSQTTHAPWSARLSWAQEPEAGAGLGATVTVGQDVAPSSPNDTASESGRDAAPLDGPAADTGRDGQAATGGPDPGDEGGGPAAGGLDSSGNGAPDVAEGADRPAGQDQSAAERGAQDGTSSSQREIVVGPDSAAASDEEQPEAGPTVGSTDAKDGAALTARVEDKALMLDITGTQGPCTLTITLAHGARLGPGIYLHAEAAQSLRPRHVDGRAVLEVGLSGDGPVFIDLLDTGDGVFAAQLEVRGTSLQVKTAETDAGQTGDLVRMARAASQYMDFAFNGYYGIAPTQHSIARIRAADWSKTGYCNDMMLNAPGDPAHGGHPQVTYQLSGFSPDPATARAQGQNYLDYIMYWGYPSDPTLGGRCPDPQVAEAATQWAVWHYTNVGSHPTWEAPADSWPAGFWDAYNWLVGASSDYDARCADQGAQGMPEYGTCKLWVVGDASLQNILTGEPGTGWLTLAKSSDHPGLVGQAGYSLEGAEYQIHSADRGIMGTLKTDSQGRAVTVLPVGSYTLKETSPPPGHGMSSDPIPFTITGGPVHVWVKATDPAVLGVLQIEKRGGFEEGQAVAGAKFRLTDKRTGKTYDLETDAKGKASTGRVLPLGDYTLRELAAPDGYGKVGDVEVQVTTEKSQVFLKLVDPFDTTIRLQKLSAKTGKGLAGAKMQLLGSNGRVVSEWTSTEGPHELRGVWPGRYTLREKEAPRGYERAADVRVDVRLTSEVQTYTMRDERSPVPFSFTKKSLNGGETLAGATFRLSECTDPAAFANSAPTWAQQRDQTLWREVATKASGQDGRVDFGLLQEGVYLLVETDAPQGFARPRDGWLVRADSESGVSVLICGEGSAPAMNKRDDTWELPNARLHELPSAGGTNTPRRVAAGSLLAAGCAFAAASARRRVREP